MQVITSHEGAATILKPMGPLVAGELSEFSDTMQELCRKWVKRIILNLGDVTFIDSAGLEMLISYQRQLNEHGLKMKLCNLTKLLQEALELTRLIDRFEIYPDTAVTLRSFL